MSTSTFFHNKSIVVTGGAGFLGRFVVRKLQERGCQKIGIPLIDHYDLTQASHIKRMYEAMRPDIVIHLAAICGGIGANMARPADFFYKNLLMGIQLMEEAHQRRIEKFVAIGTICAYPKFTPVPFKEEDLWNGYPEETNAPYGLAKKMLLVQAQTYRQQYGFNAIYLLPVNLYGPGDNFDLETGHVIPALIRKFVEAKERGGKDIIAWGTGRVSREFFFVEDAAEAILLATEKYNKPDPVNLGSGEEITILELAEKIRDTVGFKGGIRWDTSRTDGQPRRRLDTSKAKEYFGFTANVKLNDGLKKTIDWYLQNRAPQAVAATASCT
ncbi:MAG: GDP-L-fucose synthase [Elusimicrobia bacterium]|nr:GDP-L-fucose synthase [Candidatus Obscuribacterium magneticum]